MKIYCSFLLTMLFTVCTQAQNVTDVVTVICETTRISSSPPVSTPYNSIYIPCVTHTSLTNNIDFYQVVIESAGTFTFEIDPDGDYDYDFASWQNPDLTNLGTPDRGSLNSPFSVGIYTIGLSLDEPEELCEVIGSAGNSGNVPGKVRWYDVQSGDIVVIAVGRISGNSGYELTFGGTAVVMTCPFILDKCDTDRNGEESFDIANDIISALQDVYPEHILTVYDNEENAEQGTETGLLTGAYIAYMADNPTQLFARIEEENGDFVKTREVLLNVNPLPDLYAPAPLFYCTASGSSTGLFDLTTIEEQLVGDIENLTFAYYTTEIGANGETNTGRIANPANYFGSQGNVYVRIENEYGCYIVAPIPLIITQMDLEEQHHTVENDCLPEETIDLTTYLNLFTEEPQNYRVYYYQNEQDAAANNTANAITNPQQFNPTAGNFTIWLNFKLNGGVNCSSIVCSLTFSFVNMPELQLPDEPAICAGETVTLTVTTTGETVLWYTSETATTPIFTGTTFETTELTETSTFWVETIAENCRSERKPLTVTVHPLPGIETQNVNLCSRDYAILSIQTDGNTVYWYESEMDEYPIFTGNPFTTPELLQSITYWVEAVSEEGCVSERKKVSITVYPVPEINMDILNIEICSEQTATLTAGSAGRVNWYDTEQGETPIYTGNTYTTPRLFETTSYWVAAVDPQSGCESKRIEITVSVTVCTIPKGISPNGDGINDYLDLSAFLPTSVQLFNRYGKMVYEHGPGYINQWHGQDNNGQPLPEGTYFYSVRTLDREYSGYIYLSREVR